MIEFAQARSPQGTTHAFQVGREKTLCGMSCGDWTVTLDPDPAATCKLCERAYKSRYGEEPPPGFARPPGGTFRR